MTSGGLSAPYLSQPLEGSADFRGEGMPGAVALFRVAQQVGEGAVGGGAVAEGEQQLADAAAYFEGQVGVGADAAVLEVREEGAVFVQCGGGFAELLQALRGLAPELQGARVGRACLPGVFVGEAAEFGQGAAVLAVTGGMMGEGSGPAKLLASAFADWKDSENGLVTVYDADGELISTGNF